MAEVQAFFFKAMSRGWVGGGTFTDVLDMPGYKRFVYEDGDFKLIDQYCTRPGSNRSSGTTIIWHCNIPIWVMHYGGWYDEFAISIVKEALKKAYGSHVFCGGRGLPTEARKTGLTHYIYSNVVRRNDFDCFEGREEVYCVTEYALKGYHDYWGMSLL
ncbi:MAG: DUF5680 domain-containing protein [bacterium]